MTPGDAVTEPRSDASVPAPDPRDGDDCVVEVTVAVPAHLVNHLPAELPSGSPADAIAEAFAGEPVQVRQWLPVWFVPLVVLNAIAFLPWMVYLAFTLPRKVDADHYDVAWLGFDIALWLCIAGLAYCAIRRRAGFALLAAVTSAMLFVDAWFDVVTSSTRAEFMAAGLLALFAEIPGAVICAWMAINAETIHARAYRRMRLRMQWAMLLAGASARAEYADKSEWLADVSRARDPQEQR